MPEVDPASTSATGSKSAASGASPGKSASPLSRFRGAWSDKLAGRSARHYLAALQTSFMSLLKPTDYRLAIHREMEIVFLQYSGGEVDWTKAQVWDDAYKCERLMIELLGPRHIELGLERRILELQGFDKALAEFYRGRVHTVAAATAGSVAATSGAAAPSLLSAEQVESNRILLASLVGDLQWHYNQRDLKRKYAHGAQMRATGMFLIALATFAFVMYQTFNLADGGSLAQIAGADTAGGEPPAEDAEAPAAAIEE